MDKVYCSKCKVHHKVDIYDVLAKRKKRVVCGHCGSVLLTEDDIIDFFTYLSQTGWWACD